MSKEALLNLNNRNPTLPSSIVSLLLEFEDTFQNEMPPMLPLMRGNGECVLIVRQLTI